MSGHPQTPPPSTLHLDASAAFAEAAHRVGRTLAKLALERMMMRLAHIAVTGRLR